MATKVWIGGTDTSFATSANWSPSGVPTTGDVLVFDGRAERNLAAGLTPSGAFVALLVYSDFTKNIGAVTSGAVTRLELDVATVEIGKPLADGRFGSGSQLVGITCKTTDPIIRVFSTASTGTTAGLAPLLVNTSGSIDPEIHVSGGWAGFGTAVVGEAMRIEDMTIDGSAVVHVGSGATVVTVRQNAGQYRCESAQTTFHQFGGSAVCSGNITTANISGTFAYQSGTITNLNVRNNGAVDFTQSVVARTVTNCGVHGTGRINAWNGTPLNVTFTNPIAIAFDAKSEQINFGSSLNIQQS